MQFDNVRAGGNLSVQATSWQNGEGGAYFGEVTAGGELTVTGVQESELQVNAATSTNGSINVTNDYNLEVDAATLNGTDAAGRSIALTSNYSNVVFGALSTNGPAGASAAAAPLGSITITAPDSGVYDTSDWNESGQQSVLRAADVSIYALYGIQLANTAVDTHANLNLNLTDSVADYGSGSSISANLVGIDSVSDPGGAEAHAIHLVDVTTHFGGVSVSNSNGDLLIGTVRSVYDYGDGDSGSGWIYLTASGSIVSDGSRGGGRIDASDLNGNNGYLSLYAGANLGTRGTGADGTVGATYLSLGGNQLDITTHGDLFAKDDQNYINYLNLNAYYASSPSAYFYHFTAADAVEVQNATPAVTFDAASSGGLLTVDGATIDNSGSGVNLRGDGDIRVESIQAGQSASLGIYGQNVSVDAPADNSPAISMGDGSSLQIQANGSLTVGNVASTGNSPGDSYVDLEAYGGTLTLGKVSAANANVNVYANDGDIVGSAGNQVLANDLALTNTFGAIGADPHAVGSLPINIGVAGNLNISNEGGGGSINLVTLNDPASLNLTLNTPGSPEYAGADFLIAPATVGLGLSGSASPGALTLATLGTTGSSATAVPVSITVDTPSVSISSGAGAQLGIGYDLYFGGSNANVVANLSGSTGRTVVVHLDNGASPLTSLTGTLALSDLQLDSALYSSGSHRP